MAGETPPDSTIEGVQAAEATPGEDAPAPAVEAEAEAIANPVETPGETPAGAE
jgi:hypothetical protein